MTGVPENPRNWFWFFRRKKGKKDLAISRPALHTISHMEDNDIKVNWRDFYEEWAGHKVEHLEKVLMSPHILIQGF